MSFENTQDLASGDALDLSNTMRITKNDADLRRCQTFLRELTYVFFDLKKGSGIRVATNEREKKEK